MRSDLIRTHYGPETLEEAVQNYLNRHVDIYDALPIMQVNLHLHVHCICTSTYYGVMLSTIGLTNVMAT